MKQLKSIFLFLLVFSLMLGSAASAFAAAAEEAVIDENAQGSLTIYKYDYTAAGSAGILSGSFVSTGEANSAADAALAPYALEGVEFTYLQVAQIYQYSASGTVSLLYKFSRTDAAALLNAIGLENGENSVADANATDTSAWFYQSDVISSALAAALQADAVTVKNALENYIAESGTAMPLTSAAGKTQAQELPVGLYLVVETKVPESVTCTTAPFLVSLPMTTLDGTGWNYDVTVYPKNETGTVTLDKTVSNGAEPGSYVTVAGGDTVRFFLTSTVPTVTSDATALTKYTFQDLVPAGLTYQAAAGVQISWYTDAGQSNLVDTWSADSGNFAVEQTNNSDGSTALKISMTGQGLAKLNRYSDHTMVVSYQAQVKSDMSLICGNAGNTGAVTLTWQRTSTGYADSLVDDVHLYSYGMDLTKRFSDGKSSAALHEKVLFLLQRADTGAYLTAALNEADDVWYVTGSAAEQAAATKLHPVLNSAGEGHLVVKGLDAAEYTLTEIQTAENYKLLSAAIALRISTQDAGTCSCGSEGHGLPDASATVDGNAVTMAADGQASDHALAAFSVINTLHYDLPATGDSGNFWLPVAGGAGIVCGIGLLVLLRKNKNETV